MNTPDTISYREAALADVRQLAIVTSRANARRDAEPIPQTIRSYQTYDDIYLRMHRPMAWTYAATCGEKVVGFALSHAKPEEGSAEQVADAEHLSLLMVDPDYWGRRIASVLIDLTADRARELGRSRLTLWTREAENEHTRKVYEHKGFRPTGEQRGSSNGAQVKYQLELR